MMMFAVVHESGRGTKCECRVIRVMAAPKGNSSSMEGSILPGTHHFRE
jgi:hypothetical protein